MFPAYLRAALVGIDVQCPASKFIVVYGNAGPKGNLIPLPIDKSSEDSDEGKCANLVTTYLQAVILGRRCKYFFVVDIGEPRECADAS